MLRLTILGSLLLILLRLTILRSLGLLVLGLYGRYGTGVEIVVRTGIVVFVSTGIVVAAGGIHGVIQNDLIQFTAHLDQGDGDQNVKGNGQQVDQEGHEAEGNQVADQTDHAETDQNEVYYDDEHGDLVTGNDTIGSLFDYTNGANQLSIIDDAQNKNQNYKDKSKDINSSSDTGQGSKAIHFRGIEFVGEEGKNHH